MTYLLDVNLLISLFDQKHQHHEAAHRWFERTGRGSWATCPITQNGFVRIVSNPVYASLKATPEEAVEFLAYMCSAQEHVFWPDVVSIVDQSHFVRSSLKSHSQVTDLYLVSLAVFYGGRLATLDGRIKMREESGASHEFVELVPFR